MRWECSYYYIFQCVIKQDMNCYYCAQPFLPQLVLSSYIWFQFQNWIKIFYTLFFFLYPNRMSKLKTLHRPGQTEWPSVHWFIIFSHKLSIFLKLKLQTGDKITKLHSRPESKCLKFSNQSKKTLNRNERDL